MANDCLVTKLKGIVNNDNLPYLEKVLLTFNLSENFGNDEVSVASIRDSNNQSITNLGVTNLNNDGSVVNYANGYLTLKKGTESVIKVLIDKYPVKMYSIIGTDYSISPDEVDNFYLLEIFGYNGGATLEGKITSLNLKNIKKINFTNYVASDNFSGLAKYSTLEVLELHYCAGFTGDLSAIKDLPNLTTVILDHTYVTDNDNTVAYLESRGVTVTYTPYTN